MSKPVIEPTELEYHLTCRIMIKRLPYIDQQSDGRDINREGDFVFFVPIHNSEAYGFFNAWLPADERENVEVAVRLKHPFGTNARAAVRRSDARCPYHHLQLMSFGLVQTIAERREQFHGREIMVTVLPETEDAMADQTFRGDLPFDKKEYGAAPTRDEAVKRIRAADSGESIYELNDEKLPVVEDQNEKTSDSEIW